jgi:hypothetical protein
MAKLTTGAWTVHNLALATSIGGTAYGRAAMHPALRGLRDAQERDQVADTAWRRFTWMNLAAHGAMAASWFIDRQLMSGQQLRRQARSMARAKDVLVVTSLLTGVGAAVIGRALGRRVAREVGPASEREAEGGDSGESGGERRARPSARGLERAATMLGNLNMLANAGVAVVSTMLAAESAPALRGRAGSRPRRLAW